MIMTVAVVVIVVVALIVAVVVGSIQRRTVRHHVAHGVVSRSGHGVGGRGHGEHRTPLEEGSRGRRVEWMVHGRLVAGRGVAEGTAVGSTLDHRVDLEGRHPSSDVTR